MEQLLTSLASSDVCDYPTPMANFDAVSYMGTWYGQYHVKNEPFAVPGSTCTVAQYSSLNTTSLEFIVDNTFEISQQYGDTRYGVTGAATCPTAGSGECYVSFFNQEVPYPNYNVLDTDYETYAVVYSCDYEEQFPYLYYLAGQPIASNETLEYMQSFAEANLPNFNFDNLDTRVVQGDMCVYPDPKPDVLPSQETE